jgi:hypothetical protein
MSKFDLTEILHIGQSAAHPESVEVSRISNADRRELSLPVNDRLHTLTAAVTNAAMLADGEFINPLTMPEYNPQVHAPQQRSPQEYVGQSALNVAPQPQADQQTEELIDPRLAYAEADLSTIGHSPVDDADAAAAAQAAVAPRPTGAADAFFQEVGIPTPAAANQQPQPVNLTPEANQAFWNIVDDAGMQNPVVPKVVEDIDRLSADMSHHQASQQHLEETRSHIDQIYADMGKQ